MASKILTVPHHDVAEGWTHQVPAHLAHPWRAPIAEAVTKSVNEPGIAFESAGIPFIVEVDAGTQRDGNLAFWVASALPLAEGKIPSHEVLFIGCVAAQLATAPLAWRRIFQHYLDHWFKSPANLRFGAPGLMPKATPWMCGFSNQFGAKPVKPSPREMEALMIFVRLVTLALVERGIQAVQCEERKGPALLPDSTLFEELRDWDF